MQFISGLFGGSGNTILTMLFALGAVIVLIILAVWLMKVIFKVSGNGVRGRNRRLAVVDTLVLDQKRQLLIIRRDNVEHVILTGGAQDLVVETGIPVADTPAPQPLRRPQIAHAATRQAPIAPTPVTEPVRTAPAPQKAEPNTLLEELQKSGLSGDKKTRVSLRKTGLMRQTTARNDAETGQNPDISSVQAVDSANEVAHRESSEGAALENDGTNNANRG